MSGPLNVPPEADDAQRLSSDPRASVWVSANAGAGKTYVLAQRVVRLLLSGVAPRAILCLTYTTAAATEMAQRVYDELAALATMADRPLAGRIAVLAPGADPFAAAGRARTLFAEALETPGGLKVQTIHAFAAALLRRFPLEANVSGQFEVLDDATADELSDRAIAVVLSRAVQENTPEAGWVEALLPHVSDSGLVTAIKAALREHRKLTAWLRDGSGSARLAADLAAVLGDDGTPDPPEILDEATCRAVHDYLVARGKSGGETAVLLAAWLGCTDDRRDQHWDAIFFTKERAPRNRFGDKALHAAFPDFAAQRDAERERLLVVAERAAVRNAIAATVPLMQLAFAVLEILSGEKRRRGLIDYDDQIETAMNLVKTTTAASWVRFKLDEGIDHVMVDEAQDTSPPQWKLVHALTEEFFAGASARDVERTLFVVGDEKQSIYSFQGAAPRLFAEKRDDFRERANAAGKPFHAVDLAHSMRSSPQLLSAVDRVFATAALASAVGAVPGAVRHVAIKDGPGGVDLWPLFCDDETERPEEWDAPFDRAPDSAGIVKLVRAIVDQIVAWGREGPDGGPPVRPGEVMILARKREPFATLVNRELKARGIPTAGADRLDLTSHIAVKDMLALARALISRDDLSLAAVLRSPLFGFSDEALFAVAHGRSGSLFEALSEGDAAAHAARETLRRWQQLARNGRPFDLFAAILIGEGRRADFGARMGSEAEDALDAFLDESLSYEASGIPALETFLSRIARTKITLKRVADARSDAVRVMTAHGAKGLEARIVFLADVGTEPIHGSKRTLVVPLPQVVERGVAGEVLVFVPTKEHRPQPVCELLAARDDAELEEHYRLLYVGMTRAKQHLVLCGSYGKQLPRKGMWHALVHEALATGAVTAAMPGGAGLRWRSPELAATAAAAPEEMPAPPSEAPPAWLFAPAKIARRAPEPLAPSDGEKGPAEGTAEPVRRALDAATYGTLLHSLLERGGDAAAMAARVRAAAPALAERDVAALVAEAAAVEAVPELGVGRIRREIGVIGDILWNGEVRRASGIIDRLQIGGGRVLIVDYKTDRVVPATPRRAPEGYRRQLGIYKALISAMLPSYTVATALVWTARPSLMLMDDALPVVVALSFAGAGRAA